MSDQVIAAIVPEDILDDLSHEPMDLRTPPRPFDAEWFESNQPHFLLIIPDGHSYPDGWKSEFVTKGREIVKVVRAAKRSGIPVVVWRQARCLHGSLLSWLEGEADAVFSSVPGSVPDQLPVAFQPRLHNPFIDYQDREIWKALSDGIFLDGWWVAGRNLRGTPLF